MNYKIGTTTNCEGTTIGIAVPYGWENNGTLFWPEYLSEAEINTLKKDPKSLPDKNWAKKDFTIKAVMGDYLLATKLANDLLILDASDYDSGEENNNPNRESQPSIADDDPISESNSNQPSSDTANFCDEDQVDSKNIIKIVSDDKLFNLNYINDNGQTCPSTCNHDNQLIDLDTKITKCIDQNIKTHLKLDDFQKSLDLLLRKFVNDAKGFFLDAEENQELGDSLKTSSKLSKLDEIDIKISQCITSNKQTHLKIDKLQKALDVILQNAVNISIEPPQSPFPVPSKKKEMFTFPIASTDAFEELENELQSNPNLMSDLVDKFTNIAGDSGDQCAKKVGVNIMERIISPKLLTKFSWTGRTSVPNVIKLSFMNYVNIFNLCLNVISKADNSFDKAACENFFKNNILKHSSTRLARKFSKKSNRKNFNVEMWSSEPTAPENVSLMESERYMKCEQSIIVPDQETDTEEAIIIDADEIVDSKESINTSRCNNAEAETEEKNQNSSAPNPSAEKCTHENKLSNMDRKISLCVESNAKVHLKLNNMQRTLSLILNKIGIRPTPSPTSERDPDATSEIVNDHLETFYFPLTSVLDLKNLNRRLLINENFEKKLVEMTMARFVSRYGNPKKMSKQRFGIDVVESVISPQLLMKYTWTGRSKGNKPKLAFIKYKSLLNFFQKIISRVDDSFSKKECESFLKFVVLKHVNLRVNRKRMKIKKKAREHFSEEDYEEMNATRTGFEVKLQRSSNLEELYDSKDMSDMELSEGNAES